MDVDDIGENDTALLCHTNKTDCCRGPLDHNKAGEWYYPNGTEVEIKKMFPYEFIETEDHKLYASIINKAHLLKEDFSDVKYQIPAA